MPTASDQRGYRVLLLPSAYAPAVGGVEELTARLARQLVDAGHAVEVWTNRHPTTLPATEQIGGITVRRIPLPLPSAHIASLVRFAGAAALTLQQLTAEMRRFSPDLLHVQCFSSNGAWATAASALSGAPLIVTLQGETVMDDGDIYERSVSLRTALRAGIRHADAVTACSRFVLADAEARFGLAAGAGRVIFNGVDAEEEVVEKPLDLPFKRFVLAYGRLSRKKGFDLLIDAWARIVGKHGDVGLVIGGQGPVRAELDERVAARALTGRVHLPGVLDRGQVAWALRHAEVFVMPSRVEPFGIVALEAMREGCPAIVSSVGGAPEFIRDGVDGIVADPHAPAEMATALDRLLADRSLRQQLAAAGRERVAGFDWSRISREYLELYREVLEKTARNGGRWRGFQGR